MKQLLVLQEDVLLSKTMILALPLGYAWSSCAVQLDQLDSRSLALEFVGLTECSGGITSSMFIRPSCSTAELARKMCIDKVTNKLSFPMLQERNSCM